MTNNDEGFVGFLGWQAETDNDNPDDREGVYYLTVVADPGDFNEEIATIVHRVVDGKYPLDGEVARQKEHIAQVIVDALNAVRADGTRFADRLWP